MLQIKGSQEFIKRLKKDTKLLENNTAKVHRKIVEAVFTDLVTLTPQWTGNLAHNWYIEFTGIKGHYDRLETYVPPWEFGIADGDAPFKRGDDPAVDWTLTRELSKLPKIRYNTIVKLTNYAPYAEDVDNNIGPPDEFGNPQDIRDVNILQSYGGVAMKGYVEMKYSNLRNLKRLAK
jgi:hypothetical protein